MLRPLTVIITISLLLLAGCGESGDVLLSEGASLESVSVSPRVAKIGAGYSIPFNEPFSFDTAVASDPKTAQLSVIGMLSNGISVELPLNPQSATFSNLGDGNVVSPSGTLSVNSIKTCGGSSTAQVSYSLSGTTRTDSFLIQTACFVATAGSVNGRAEPFVPAGGSYDKGFVAQFRGPDSVDHVLSGSELTYSLREPIDGVSVSADTGKIQAGADVPAGTRLTVLVNFQDSQTGLSLNSEVSFEVVASSK